MKAQSSNFLHLGSQSLSKDGYNEHYPPVQCKTTGTQHSREPKNHLGEYATDLAGNKALDDAITACEAFFLGITPTEPQINVNSIILNPDKGPDDLFRVNFPKAPPPKKKA